MKTYKIGEMTYTQDELVLSQEEALSELVGPLLTEGDASVKVLVDKLLREGALRKALAVILVPEGQTVATRDLDAVETHLKDHITLTQQGQVVRDFFDCNGQAASALRAFAEDELPKTAPAGPKA